MFLLQAFNKTDDGWVIYNDTQYYINPQKLDMELARAFCRKNSGELAVITGDSERKFIWKQARNSEYTVHVYSKKHTQSVLNFTVNTGLLFPM